MKRSCLGNEPLLQFGPRIAFLEIDRPILRDSARPSALQFLPLHLESPRPRLTRSESFLDFNPLVGEQLECLLRPRMGDVQFTPRFILPDCQDQADLKSAPPYGNPVARAITGFRMEYVCVLSFSYSNELPPKGSTEWLYGYAQSTTTHTSRPGAKSSRTSTLRAQASRQMLSMDTLRSARSTDPTYVRWIPARSASASCDKPRIARNRRRFAATRTRPFAGRSEPGARR